MNSNHNARSPELITERLHPLTSISSLPLYLLPASGNHYSTAFYKFSIFGFHTNNIRLSSLSMSSRSIHTDSGTSFSLWLNDGHRLCLPHLRHSSVSGLFSSISCLLTGLPTFHLFYRRLACVFQITCIGCAHITDLHGNSLGPQLATELIPSFPSSSKSPQFIPTSLYASLSHYSFSLSQCFSHAGIKYVIIKGPKWFYFLNGVLLIWGRSGFQAPGSQAG